MSSFKQLVGARGASALVGAVLAILVVAAPAPAQNEAAPVPPSNPAPGTEPGQPPAPDSTPTPQKPEKKPRLQLGVETGVFIPTDGLARDRFGGTSFSLSPALGAIRQCDTKGKFGYDFKLFYNKQGDNYALWAPVGVDYRRALTDSSSARPYVGGSLDAVPVWLRAEPEGVPGKLRMGVGGSLFLGALFGTKRYVEARYTAVSKIKGFDLSGLTIGAGMRF